MADPETTSRETFFTRWERVIKNLPSRSDGPWSREQLNSDFHLRCVEAALEDAQSCIMGETPEDGIPPEEAAGDSLVSLRDALLKHLPEIRKALQLT